MGNYGSKWLVLLEIGRFHVKKCAMVPWYGHIMAYPRLGSSKHVGKPLV